MDPVAQSVITGWLEEPRRAVALLWAPSGGVHALAWPRLLRQLRGMQRPKAQNGRVFFLGGERWQKGRWGDEEFSVWMMGLNDRMMG